MVYSEPCEVCEVTFLFCITQYIRLCLFHVIFTSCICSEHFFFSFILFTFFCVLFPYGLEMYGKIIHYYFSIMFFRIISPFCNWDKACGRYFQRRKITYQCNLDHSFLSKSCFIFLSSFWNCLVSITSLSIICVKGCRLDISLCRFPSAFRTLG